MRCAICDSEQTTPFLVASDMYTDGNYRIVRCNSCGLIRTEQPTSSDHLYVYGKTANAGARFGGTQRLLQTFRRARARQFLGRQAGRVLDVGCGDGSFLLRLAQSGWDVFGTELSESIAVSAKLLLKDRIHIGDLEYSGHPDGSFDLITFWHVIEHLDDARAALGEARRLIKPDGLAVVAVPNISSLQAQMFQQDWLHLDVPRHRWHFDAQTLTALAERCNFGVEQIRHFSLEYGPFGILQGVASKLGWRHVLFTRLVRLPPSQLLREPLFWAHMLLITVFLVPSILLEIAAAIVGRGGAIVMVLRPKEKNGSH